MTVKDSPVRQVDAGDIIKPWLILGPFYEDLSNRVQGLTLFEKPGSNVGRALMAEIVEEAEGILISRPREGNETAFCGQPARWGLVRRPDRYLSWGTYNISNHLGAAFISTVVVPEEQGIRQWRLITRITSRVVVAINGMSVYDTDAHPVNQVNGCFEYNFTAALQPDENVLTVGMFRLGRMAQIGCRLEVTDSSVRAHVPLAEGMLVETRERVEKEVAGIRLARDIFYPEHEVGITFEVAPVGTVQVRLISQEGQVLREAAPTAAEMVSLCRGKDLVDGHYQIDCTWLDDTGKPFTSIAYDIGKVTPIPACIGYDRL